ncbi:pyruvate kinase [Dorcoceras hygrometricum]|uniref:Pyruvate kinase n=1 Tax=Dorcoceras hygrometricum TaxID=472368 RepID=A0A2Z7BXV7_9LAMI|nr:pyruvate kinase [Dorcoceras hygrometricum]
MVSDRDLPVLKGAEDIEAVGHFAANLTSAMAWGDEVVRRLTRAHRTVKASRRKFDEAMGRHAEMVARLEELEVLRAQDEVVAAAQRRGLEAELATEKEARAAETRAREALGAELERANARAERAKEDFLKSPEFDFLLAKKAWGYFKDGFWGCLPQFRSNGYSEEEHPASFLDLQQALENLGDDDDAEDEEEEQEEGEVDGDAEANPLNSPKP